MNIRLTDIKWASLTQDLIKSILHYEPTTGLFTWKVRLSPRKGIGDEAGSREADGYIRIQIRRKHYPAHCLAWLYVYGVMANQIDHKDGNTSNNRIDNLRLATTKDNGANRKIGKNNTSGYKGVWLSVRRGRKDRWRAVIVVDNEHVQLGSFDTKEEAAKRYNEAAIHYFGEFAKLNELDKIK